MRAAWLLPVALAACAPPPSGAPVTVSASAHIDAPPAAVYARIADPVNEARLRPEAPRFEADGPLALGTTYIETIDLGLVNDYRMKVRVTALEPGYRVRLDSPPDWPRVFAVERTFLPEGSGTRLIYVVKTEDRVVRDIAILPVPLPLATRIYQVTMESYLRRLAAEF